MNNWDQVAMKKSYEAKRSEGAGKTDLNPFPLLLQPYTASLFTLYYPTVTSNLIEIPPSPAVHTLTGW